ncbi:MAG: DUF2061 domain-containing protein [Candidatus Nanoarchaeia archaeon]|nr:DUF2061 domain-containing protein [Candidatus Nanoarchaeia archaeon]MDD5357534.1 DUF2061 domain-containing protein [Candidatus Nanoarchaeia archaeon]MDD5588453.1 DUF2061 domain-containing protein [Candidatus Nanoarchaeia archaeon]
MASTCARSFTKGVSWELIAFVLTTAAVYLVYGNFTGSVVFAFVLTLIKMGLFFVHERIWKKIKWGKYHMVKGRKVWE